jgi:hypothetical protein
MHRFRRNQEEKDSERVAKERLSQLINVNDKEFDVTKLIAALNECGTSLKNDMYLKDFVRAVHETTKINYKFTGLGFLSRASNDRMLSMIEYWCKDPEHYETIGKMAAYEFETGLLKQKDNCTNLFIECYLVICFLCRMLEKFYSDPNVSTTKVCLEAFDEVILMLKN